MPLKILEPVMISKESVKNARQRVKLLGAEALNKTGAARDQLLLRLLGPIVINPVHGRIAKRFFAKNPDLNVFELKIKRGDKVKTLEFSKFPDGRVFAIKAEKIGEGATCTVHVAKMLNSKEYFVVKKLNESSSDVAMAQQEIAKFRFRHLDKKNERFINKFAVIEPKKNNSTEGTKLVWVTLPKLYGEDGSKYIKELFAKHPIKAGPPKRKPSEKRLSQASVMQYEDITIPSLNSIFPKDKIADYIDIESINANVEKFEKNYAEFIMTKDFKSLIDKADDFLDSLGELQAKEFKWDATQEPKTQKIELSDFDKNDFLDKFSTLIDISESLCKDDIGLMEQNRIDIDSKYANLKILQVKQSVAKRIQNSIMSFIGHQERVTKYTTSRMDAAGIQDLNEKQQYLLENLMPIGATPGYLSPYNQALFSHVNTDRYIIEQTRKLLALITILKKNNAPNIPEKLLITENIEELTRIAKPPPYIFNFESTAATTGIMIEKLTRALFKDVKVDATNFTSDANDPYAELIVQVLKITKKMLNPQITHGYTSDKALADLEVLKQRIKAMKQVEHDLNNPESYSFGNTLYHFTRKIKPYIGASLQALAADDKVIKNVILSLAVELDPRKYEVKANAARSVIISDAKTHKALSSIDIVNNPNTNEKFVEARLSEDEELIVSDLRATAALAAKGKPIELRDCEHNPEYAVKIKKIAEELKIQVKFDAATEAAVEAYKKTQEPQPPIDKPNPGAG